MKNKQYKEFLLKNNGEKINLEGKWFMTKSICISDICAAVWLTPRRPRNQSGEWSESEAKNELYSFLRWLHHLLMKEDLVRPVAAVASKKDFIKFGSSVSETLSSWGGDQDWHRGNFTFFFEEDDEKAGDRMSDLLAPEPPTEIDFSKLSRRDDDSILLKIKAATPADQDKAEWFEALKESLKKKDKEPLINKKQEFEHKLDMGDFSV